MKNLVYISSKKYLKNNINKFLYLESSAVKKNNTLIVDSSNQLKENLINVIETYFKLVLNLTSFRWMIRLNKNRTKKSLGSKLGNGKGKIEHYFKNFRKYNPIIGLINLEPESTKAISINKTLGFRFKFNVRNKI